MAPRDRQRLQPRTPIQSGGPGGEFGGSQRLYTGRNPFMTPNDPGMDFGAPPGGSGGQAMPRRPGWGRPPSMGPDWGRPPSMGPGWPERPRPMPMPMPMPMPKMPMPRVPIPMPMPRVPGGGRDWFGGEEGIPSYPNPRLPLPDDEGIPEYPYPRMPREEKDPWERYMQPMQPMSSGDYLAENFGGGLGDQFARNDGARGMLEEAAIAPSDWRTLLKLQERGIDPGPYTEEAAIAPSDWRSILKLQERGIDPEPHIEQVKWGGPKLPRPGQPWPPLPGSPLDEFDTAELTQDQADYMRNPYFSPGLESAPSADELFNRVKDREDKGSWWPEMLGGRGPQEPTTRDEFDEYYNELKNSYYS